MKCGNGSTVGQTPFRHRFIPRSDHPAVVGTGALSNCCSHRYAMPLPAAWVQEHLRQRASRFGARPIALPFRRQSQPRHHVRAGRDHALDGDLMGIASLLRPEDSVLVLID